MAYTINFTWKVSGSRVISWSKPRSRRTMLLEWTQNFNYTWGVRVGTIPYGCQLEQNIRNLPFSRYFRQFIVMKRWWGWLRYPNRVSRFLVSQLVPPECIWRFKVFNEEIISISFYALLWPLYFVSPLVII